MKYVRKFSILLLFAAFIPALMGPTGGIPSVIRLSRVGINTAPVTGRSLQIQGQANQWSEYIQSSTTAGQAYGLSVNGGTNSSDIAFAVLNSAGGSDYFRVRGDGLVTVGGLTLPTVTTAQVNCSSGTCSTASSPPSRNISSYTRNSAGDYVVNFSSAAPSANGWNCVVSATPNVGNARIAQSAYNNGTSITVFTRNPTTGALTDSDFNLLCLGI